MGRLAKLSVLGCGVVLFACLAGCAAFRSHPRLSETATVRAAEPIDGYLAAVPRESFSRQGDSPYDLKLGLPVVTTASFRPGDADKETLPERYDDELLPAPRPLEEDRLPGLTLDQVIHTTLVADPQLRAGFETINQANADALTAALLPNPELNVEQTLLPLTRPFTPEREGGPPQLDVFVSYPIDWFVFGKRAAEMASAALGVRVTEAEYADLIRERVLEAAEAFYDVLEAKALRELARLDYENFQNVEGRLRQAVELGGVPRVEWDRVRLDMLNSQRELRDAGVGLVQARARLRALLGRADADPHFDVEGDLDLPLPGEPLPVEQAFALAVDNRPDIAGRRWQLDQAQADIVVEHRNAYPEMRTALGYSRQFQRRVLEMPDANSWGVGVEMSLPVFNRNQGNRLKAQSLAAQAQHNLQVSLVELRSEIEQVAQEMRIAYQNAEAVAGEQLELATRMRDAITRAYQVGGVPLIDFLDAQRSFRETYRTYITSRAEYWRTLYRLNAAIGKQVHR